MKRVCTSGIVTVIVRLSLLLGFTATAAVEELRSLRQQHANSAAATVAILQAQHKEATRLAGENQAVYKKQYYFN